MCCEHNLETIKQNYIAFVYRCTLCFGTAGVSREKHSRTTCPKLLVHGVSKTLKLEDLQHLGARSLALCRHDYLFQHESLSTELPSCWVHILIQDFFAAAVLGVETLIFKVTGLNNIGDVIAHKETFVRFEILAQKFKKCMNSNQAKRVMILSHSAGQFVHDNSASAAAHVSSQNSAEGNVISNFSLIDI